MKANSDTSFRSRPEAMQTGRAEIDPQGHLFLGYKLLGELRILMRLSSAANAGDDAGSKGTVGQSF